MINLGAQIQAKNLVSPKASMDSSVKAKSSSIDKKSDSSFDEKLNEKIDNKINQSESLSTRNEKSESNAVEKSVDKTESSVEEQTQYSKKSKEATKAAAMNLFLTKMETELGVDSDEILEAFSELTAEDMLSSPEVSADKVIAKLNLKPEESEKALGYYNEMLAITAAVGMSQYLGQQKQAADFKVLNKSEQRMQELRSSLSDMNDKFFLNGSYTPARSSMDMHSKVEQMSQLEQNALRGAEKNEKESQPFFANNEKASAAGLGASPVLTESAQTTAAPADPTSLQMSSSEPAVSSMRSMKATDMASGSEKSIGSSNLLKAQTDMTSAQNLNLEAAAPQAVKPEAFMASPSGAHATELTATTQPVVSAAGGAPLADYSDSSEGREGELSGESQADISAQAVTPQNLNKPDSVKGFMVNPPMATDADVQANVKEVISQAQFLATKGGGEMKVSLNPEGLGEVNLKVKMNGGQVNVEMVASSDEAKKTLEKGLGELKESLALHKLHLDSIKIEHGKELSNQLDQQRQNLEQGYQQKFLGDFKERNQGFKREMFEFGAPSVPTAKLRDIVTYDPSKKKKADASRRLDLVA